MLGGVLTLAGAFWRFTLLGGPPRVGVLESLDRVTEPGPIGVAGVAADRDVRVL